MELKFYNYKLINNEKYISASDKHSLVHKKWLNLSNVTSDIIKNL